LRKDVIDFDDNAIEALELPTGVLASLKHLKTKAAINFYGVVSCPLMQNMFLRKK